MPEYKRVLVCGGRDYHDMERISEVLDRLPPEAVVVHGAASGADTCAHAWWHDIMRREAEPHPADWKQFGKAAGPIRNQEMLDTGVDLVIAFPGDSGTRDMTDRAVKAFNAHGKPDVWVIGR